MRNLPAPVSDAIAQFDLITGEKRGDVGARLGRLRKHIVPAYALYAANTQTLHRIAAVGLKGVREKALLHAYSSPTKTMKLMRAKLLAPDLDNFDECPYCGISEPKTLDHYLPKESYPEFSIYPSNLIPICHVCNSLYKRALFTENGNRLFIHSYFDIFPNSDFLHVQVGIGQEITLVFTSKMDTANVAFSNLFANHFNKLGLNERFVRKSTAEISRKRSALRRIYVNGGAAAVSRELQDVANELRAALSGNHWKVALYEGLAGSVDFCNMGFMKAVKK